MQDNLQLIHPAIEHAEIMLDWENNPENWEVSENNSEYSLADIIELIRSFSDTSQNQYRYMIEFEGELIGAVDLFQIDRSNNSAGVGILIADKKNRQRGLGKKALLELEQRAIDDWEIIELWANIQQENNASTKLFESAGYTNAGDSSDKQRIKLVRKWLKK